MAVCPGPGHAKLVCHRRSPSRLFDSAAFWSGPQAPRGCTTRRGPHDTRRVVPRISCDSLACFCHQLSGVGCHFRDSCSGSLGLAAFELMHSSTNTPLLAAWAFRPAGRRRSPTHPRRAAVVARSSRAGPSHPIDLTHLVLRPELTPSPLLEAYRASSFDQNPPATARGGARQSWGASFREIPSLARLPWEMGMRRPNLLQRRRLGALPWGRICSLTPLGGADTTFLGSTSSPGPRNSTNLRRPWECPKSG